MEICMRENGKMIGRMERGDMNIIRKEMGFGK
jgi:hypothetical protein